MDEMKLAEFQEDFSMLIEAGFVAIKQLDGISAKRLFDAAAVLRPGDTAPKIGLGHIALNKMEIKEASKIFQEVINIEPENQIAQIYYGMCLILLPGMVKKGEEIVRAALEKTTDPAARNLGEVSLKLARSAQAKQSSSPFFEKEGK